MLLLLRRSDEKPIQGLFESITHLLVYNEFANWVFPHIKYSNLIVKKITEMILNCF